MRIEVDAEDVQRKIRSMVDLGGIIERRCADRIQEKMRTTAARKLTDRKAVDTGLLRNSIEMDDGYNSFVEHPEEGVSIGIRTDVSYALFIEYGTGPKGDPEIPHTSKSSWVYPTGDPERPFKVAVSQPARPFMRPALYNNRKAFLEIIKDGIKEEFEA
jgi:hypothetical protein